MVVQPPVRIPFLDMAAAHAELAAEIEPAVLRVLRRGIADKKGIPPYVIFHDSVLVEMSAAKPQTLDDLRGIKGIGEKKLEKYGQLFLDVIKERLLEAKIDFAKRRRR